MHQTFSKDAPREIIKGIGITSLFFGLSFYLPFLGFILSFLLPLPIMFYRLKLGRENASLVAAGTLLIVIFFLGSFSFDFFFFAHLLILGFALGEFFEQGLSVEKTILYACAVFWASAAGVLILVSLASGIRISEMLSNLVRNNLELSVVFYEQMGAPQEQIEMLKGSLDLVQKALTRVILGVTTAGVLFTAWCNLLLARPVLLVANIKFPDFGRLNTWKAPEQLVWGVIACGFMLMLPIGGIKILPVNGLMIFMTIYFFQGIAIISYFFEKKDIPLIIRILFYSFIGLQIFLFMLVTVIGFFDMWLDLRKLDTPEKDQ